MLPPKVRLNQDLHRREPVGAYGSPFHCGNGSVANYDQLGVQQSHSHKQISMKPGAIIHTMIPKVFESDQQYPVS